MKSLKSFWQFSHYFFGIVVLLFIWQWLSTIYPEAIIPSLGNVWKAFLENLFHDDLFINIVWSVWRVFLSTILSVFIGIFLGVLGGGNSFIYKALYPLFILFENVPPIAWMVLTIMWFSIGSAPSVTVGIITAVPIVFFYSVDAVRETPQKLLEMTRDFSLSKKEQMFLVYLPHLMPAIGASVSGALALSWRVVVMAEALSAYDGIGQKLWGSYLYGDSSVSYAYIFAIGVLGLFMEYFLVKPIKNILDKRYGS